MDAFKLPALALAGQSNSQASSLAASLTARVPVSSLDELRTRLKMKAVAIGDGSSFESALLWTVAVSLLLLRWEFG